MSAAGVGLADHSPLSTSDCVTLNMSCIVCGPSCEAGHVLDILYNVLIQYMDHSSGSSVVP